MFTLSSDTVVMADKLEAPPGRAASAPVMSFASLRCAGRPKVNDLSEFVLWDCQRMCNGMAVPLPKLTPAEGKFTRLTTALVSPCMTDMCICNMSRLQADSFIGHRVSVQCPDPFSDSLISQTFVSLL